MKEMRLEINKVKSVTHRIQSFNGDKDWTYNYIVTVLFLIHSILLCN